MSIRFDGNVPKVWKDFANKHASAISEIYKEADNRYWVYLRPSWIDIQSGMHQFRATSIKELKEYWQYVQREEI